MVTTVQARPNHYEILGLTPAASADEIVRAFARELSPLKPHAFGGLAVVSLAYEVLRDPVKRRAYDRSLGLRQESTPADRSSTSPRFEAAGESRTGFVIAAALRESARPQASESYPERQRQIPKRLGHSLEPMAATEEPVTDVPRIDRSIIDDLHEAPGLTLEWKRPGVVIAALFVGVGLTGALAGLWSGRAIAPQEASAAVSLAPEHPLPGAKTLEAAPEPTSEHAATLPAQPARIGFVRARRTPARVQPAIAPRQLRASDIQAIDLSPRVREAAQASGGPSSTAAASDAAPARAQSTAAVAPEAALPLPDRVVARTIERIGYACGQVESAIAVEGEPGVFKVTCTSGDSYKAAPVRGRYHFRRFGVIR